MFRLGFNYTRQVSTIAPKLPRDCPEIGPKSGRSRPEKSHVVVDGRKWTLELHCGFWRIRSRRKGRSITKSLKLSNLVEAREEARKWIAAAEEGRWTRKGKGSLETLAATYLEIPKRVSTKATTTNVSRLRTVVRVALGKELSEVSAAAVGPDLWAAYYREALKKYDRKLDYTTRATENARLNAAVRAARSMFLSKYAKPYAEAGVFLNADAAKAALLPEPWLPRPEAKDVDLVDVWPTWRNSDPALWLAVGLARFAGLRRDEIWHCRRNWIEERDGTVFVVMRDRPEEKWQTKTGRPYRALVLDAELAAFLSSAPAETVFFPDATEKWFVNHVCNALRPFTGKSNKPLHRLRGLYADQLTRETEEAIIAKRAGIAAAQQGLGHTSSQTTERHYLDALR